MSGGYGFWNAAGGGGSGGTTIELLHVRDEKASGVAGGTFTAGAWQTRELNTVLTNEITDASLASNEIELPAGTYEIDARCPTTAVQQHRARLYDVTSAAVLLYGPSAYSAAANNGVEPAVIRGRFTLASTSTVRVEHRCAQTKTTNGLGVHNGFGGNEVYADVMIRRIS